MTESLLFKLEEKMMVVLAEVETLRRELKVAREENSILRHEKAKHSQKLEGLVSLLDSLTTFDAPAATTATHAPNFAIVEPIAAEG